MLRYGLIGLALALVSATAGVSGPTGGAVRSCDVKLNVTDNDPAGLNVRDAPAGAVIGTLKAHNTWVQVHVTGDAGGWMRIDGAMLYDDTLPEGEKRVFSRTGFVAVSKLGFETINPGGSLYASPNDQGRAIFTAPISSDVQTPGVVLGCTGDYLQVQIGKLVGWTRNSCSNQRTTCV